jgi:hypothetical protein
MSLINEALKKAQRQRHDDPAGAAGPAAGAGGAVAGRSGPRPLRTLLLLATGAFVLIAASVVFTVYFVNEPAPPPAPPRPKKKVEISQKAPAPVTAPAAVSPATKPPAASAPPKVETPAPAPLPAATPLKVERAAEPITAEKPTPAPTPAPLPPEATAVAVPPPAPPKPSTAEPIADARVQAFVDTMRISGVKAAGAESRVLLNDRVYRLNDIVDRPLNVRLIKVESSSVTFSDGGGFTYVKYF